MKRDPMKIISLAAIFTLVTGCEAYWNRVVFGIEDTGWEVVGDPAVASGVYQARLFVVNDGPVVLYTDDEPAGPLVRVREYSSGS